MICPSMFARIARRVHCNALCCRREVVNVSCDRCDRCQKEVARVCACLCRLVIGGVASVVCVLHLSLIPLCQLFRICFSASIVTILNQYSYTHNVKETDGRWMGHQIIYGLISVHPSIIFLLLLND